MFKLNATMIKLRTLFLLVPFIALFSCSDEESSGPIYNTLPVAADCKLGSYSYVESIDSANINFLRYENTETYTYESELLKTYRDDVNFSFIDTAGQRQEQSGFIVYDFEYSGTELVSVQNNGQELLGVRNVDGRPYILFAEASSGGQIEFVMEYDDQNRLKYVYNKEDQGGEISTISHYEMTYDNLGNIVEFSLTAANGTKELINDFQYNGTMKNPYQGLIFFIISLFETSFEEDGMFFGNASKLSPSMSQFYRLSIYNYQTESYERSQYVEADFDEDMTYTMNGNNYPKTGSMTFNFAPGIITSINETYTYTNCD